MAESDGVTCSKGPRLESNWNGSKVHALSGQLPGFMAVRPTDVEMFQSGPRCWNE